jgi:hypothetical protein
VVFDLAQIINLLWISIKTRLFGRTPRDIREWTQPPEFEYAIYYSNLLFMAAVGLVFAPLAPLVVVSATVVFWMSSWVYKYQLMFVFVSKVETGGRLWNVIINRLLFCVLLMQMLMVLTIGLQYRFRSLAWLTTLPPILIVILFKFYLNRSILPAFNYYNPTEEELRMAKVHSERSDTRGNRLEKRFGHPSLHTELFTPMLHANMASLLSQVYSGKIARDEAKLDEYGGQKMQTQVVEGIKIAAIQDHQLEYDPALYQRDRGELDWDRRSIASTTLFDGDSTLQPAKSQYYANESTLQFQGRERYLAQGPGSIGNKSEFEMSAMEASQEPLLSPRSLAYQQQQTLASQPSFAASVRSSTYSQDPPGMGQAPPHPPQERSYSPFQGDQAPSYAAEPPHQQGYPPQRAYSPQPGYQHAPPSYPPQRTYSPQPGNHPGYPPQRTYSPQPGNNHPGYAHQQQPSQGQQLNQFSHHLRQSSNNNRLAGQGASRGY